jgi:hypothetical protein
VLAALEDILRRQGESSELAEILAREAELSPAADQQAHFLAELGRARWRRSATRSSATRPTPGPAAR